MDRLMDRWGGRDRVRAGCWEAQIDTQTDIQMDTARGCGSPFSPSVHTKTVFSDTNNTS